DRIDRPVQFRLFPGVVSSDNSYLPFAADIRAALGANAPVQIMPFCPYSQYMGLLEEGDLTLDSFHFAGSNTVAESLYLRKPTPVLEGDKWYNRIGPSMLRLVGLHELICTCEDEYINKALQLIRDDSHREGLSARLQAADLERTVFSTEHASSFRRAIDFLIT